MKHFLAIASCTLLFLWTAGSGFAQDVASNSNQTRTLIEVNAIDGPEDQRTLAITGARLVDGLGGAPVDDAVVIVKGNRIQDVGPRNQVEIPANAQHFDVEGRTVMPGLLDAHLHNVMDNERINRFLRNGITTIRDPGLPMHFHQSLHFADQPVPRVFLTGAHLDGFPPVYEQEATVVRSTRHARETVHMRVREGASGIKIYFNLPLKYYETVTDAAAQNDIPVMAHLELVDADDAIRAGVEGFEHVSSFGTALADSDEAKRFKDALRENYGARRTERFRIWSRIDLGSSRVQDVIDLAVENDVVMTPTLGVFERYEDEDGIEDFHVEGYQNMARFIGMAHESGIRIALGSHAGLRHADSGWDYQHEMELLVNAGMDPMDVIVSSTSGNARFFRSDKRIGSIEEGKLADLLIIQGDPTEDIRAMRNIDRVMLNGVWVRSE